MSKVRVERGNVVLKVEEYEVQRYMSLGYSVTDEYGKVLKAAVPTNLGQLQLFYVQATKKIAELEAKIAELEASKVATPPVADAPVADAPVTKRGRKSKE